MTEVIRPFYYPGLRCVRWVQPIFQDCFSSFREMECRESLQEQDSLLAVPEQFPEHPEHPLFLPVYRVII